jgi:hypothetical protein
MMSQPIRGPNRQGNIQETGDDTHSPAPPDSTTAKTTGVFAYIKEGLGIGTDREMTELKKQRDVVVEKLTTAYQTLDNLPKNADTTSREDAEKKVNQAEANFTEVQQKVRELRKKQEKRFSFLQPETQLMKSAKEADRASDKIKAIEKDYGGYLYINSRDPNYQRAVTTLTEAEKKSRECKNTMTAAISSVRDLTELRQQQQDKINKLEGPSALQSSNAEGSRETLYANRRDYTFRLIEAQKHLDNVRSGKE